MIVGVAIKKEQTVFYLPEPYRHNDVIKMMTTEYSEKKPFALQGFITDDWRFLDRKNAAIYALYNKQCKKLIAPPRLFSEDLW